jgi:putative lysine transport system permease protein
MNKTTKRIISMFMAVVAAVGILTASGINCLAMETTATDNAAGNKKVLKVAMECSYAPYNWTQSTDENGAVPISESSDYAYGYDVRMAKKIADELGYELEIVKLDWDSLVPAVQSGKVDCVIAGQSITKKRLQSVDFTEPYYYASIVTLVKKGGKYENAKSVNDLSGATCTSQINTIWYDNCLPQIPNANILSAQESAPAMMVSLESGRCDLVVTDKPTAQAALVAYPKFKLLDFTGTDGEFNVSDEDVNIGISVRKGNTELKDSINQVLSKMDKEDYNKMMEEVIAVQPKSLSTNFFGRILFILKNYGSSLLRGVGKTMAIAIVGTFIGCLIGFAVGIVQTVPVSKSENAVKWGIYSLLKIILNIYVEVFRGTPMMVQAMFIFYGSSALFNINMSITFAAYFIVSINTGAYMAETVRGGILSIDSGQTEGAMAIGMNHFQTMLNVIMPQALRNIMPQIGNNLIINIKDTCVLSVIGVVELFYSTKGVAGAYYTYFEAFTITMIIYFILTFTCSRILRVWEKKMDGPDNYDLATTDTLAYTSGMVKFPESKDKEGK